MECMIGCMRKQRSRSTPLELACAKKIVTKIDSTAWCSVAEDHISPGAVFNEKNITVSDAPGMGIQGFVPGKVSYLIRPEQTASRKHTGAVSLMKLYFIYGQ